jgi:ABC-type Zn uptake system ZnuABC Zn-binding protein ZnuA
MHKRHNRLLVGAVIAFAGLGVAARQSAPAAIRVVTSTPTLADITRQIGGDHVKVESIMRGPENVHNVSPKPSFMMKLRKADLFIHSGLDAEPWVPLLIKGARNPDLLYGQPGNVDVSPGITLKEVPKRGELSRALGDIHVYGNTHYALDPMNGVIMARTIALALTRADPGHRNEFDANYEAFAERMHALTERLTAEMAPYRGTPVVTYHRTWPYFLGRFGLIKVAEVEPKPGIAPGPQHLTKCVETMTGHGAKIVIVETYNPKKNADNVARRVEGHALVLAQGVRAVPEADTYENLFEYNVSTLLAAFEELGIKPRTETSRP